MDEAAAKREIEVDGARFAARVVDGATEVVLRTGPRPGAGFRLSATASDERITHEARRFLRAMDPVTGAVAYE